MTSDDIKKQGPSLLPSGRILGIDLGEAHVGVAISDESQSLATGYAALKFEGYEKLVEQLKQIALRESVSEFVVGLPLNMNGSPSQMARRIEKLARLLKKKTRHPVHLKDERLSTVEAARLLHLAGRKVRKELVDMAAATVILQAFLDERKQKC